MASLTLSDKRLVDCLVDVFRANGYEGTTLSLLQDATGLKRSSLYHRFPQGKLDMALAAANEIMRRFDQFVLAPCSEEGPLQERVDEIGRRLTTFYGDGQISCLVASFSVGSPDPEISTHMNMAASGWIAAFADLALESGHDIDAAQAVAMDAVAAIEGALILTKATSDRDVFRRAVESLPGRLLLADPSEI